MSKRALAVKPVPGALAPHDAREALLKAAGLTDVEQARLLKLAVSAAEAGLEAMSPLAPTMPDTYARMSAARLLLTLIGANPKTGGQAVVVPQAPVIINLPDYTRPPELEGRAASWGGRLWQYPKIEGA